MGKREIDYDFCINIHGFPVDPIGTIDPAVHRFFCCLKQHWVSAHRFELRYFAVSRHHGSEDDWTFNMPVPGCVRIAGPHVPDQLKSSTGWVRNCADW